MRSLKPDQYNTQRLVFTIFMVLTVDRGLCIRRKSHVQTDKQRFLELICDTLRLDCNTNNFGMDNPTQGPLYHLQDSLVPGHNYAGKSNDTLPPELLISQSSIQYAGLGVFTLKDLPLLTMMGPFRGVIVPAANHNESTLSYAWQIDKDFEYHHLVDAQDETTSNWMRYVNSPNIKVGANLMAYQSKGEMMYRTIKHIPPCTELLLWYGDNYGRYLEEMREEREDDESEESDPNDERVTDIDNG